MNDFRKWYSGPRGVETELMHNRFGSEMAWDSTGQEGVFAWSKYFNDTTTALNSLNSILAYQPTVAHWGYNGNARRYW